MQRGASKKFASHVRTGALVNFSWAKLRGFSVKSAQRPSERGMRGSATPVSGPQSPRCCLGPDPAKPPLQFPFERRQPVHDAIVHLLDLIDPDEDPQDGAGDGVEHRAVIGRQPGS